MTTQDDISKLPANAWQRLKQRTLSVETIRQVDRIAIELYHIPSLVLMEHAAGNCAEWIVAHWAELLGPQGRPPAMPRVVVLCGRGNNGGDGLVIARKLSSAGWNCQVFLLGPIDQLSDDTAVNWQLLNAPTLHSQPVHAVLIEQDGAAMTAARVNAAIAQCNMVIDAMLGTAARGQPRAPLADWILLANQSTAVRIAIDVPTGLNASTGEHAEATFRAHATLTFLARKPGFDTGQAQEFLGQVEVLPIGIPDELMEEILVR